VLSNKEYQNLLLIKHGILICHLATDSINAGAPQLHLTSGRSSACLCCFYGKIRSSVSRWSGSHVYFDWEKPQILSRNTESETGIHPHSVTPPITLLQTVLILIPELF